MLHLVAAIVFLVLGSMVVLMLAAGHLPRNFAAGAALLAPLIGVAAAFWAWIGSVAHEAAPSTPGGMSDRPVQELGSATSEMERRQQHEKRAKLIAAVLLFKYAVIVIVVVVVLLTNH